MIFTFPKSVLLLVKQQHFLLIWQAEGIFTEGFEETMLIYMLYLRIKTLSLAMKEFRGLFQDLEEPIELQGLKYFQYDEDFSKKVELFMKEKIEPKMGHSRLDLNHLCFDLTIPLSRLLESPFLREKTGLFRVNFDQMNPRASALSTTLPESDFELDEETKSNLNEPEGKGLQSSLSGGSHGENCSKRKENAKNESNDSGIGEEYLELQEELSDDPSDNVLETEENPGAFEIEF